MNSQLPEMAPETFYTENPVVACDGSEGALGHPRVYLKMDMRGWVDCGYCDRHFVLSGGPADGRQKAA